MDAAPKTAEQQLAEARRAWRERHWAEHELTRLRRYARLTPGMKADQQQHAATLRRAEETLARTLGVQQ